MLGLSWEFRTYHTARVIRNVIEAKNTDELGLSQIAIEPGKPVMTASPSPAVGECIFAFFQFETKLGRGRGIVNLTATDNSGAHWKAFTMYTCLQELKGCEERARDRRPRGLEKGETKNWLDKRQETESMESAEPTVIVIGAGQGGLNLAARLGTLDILTLVIERNPRVGDNWRNRYKSYLPRTRFLIEGLFFMIPFGTTICLICPSLKTGLFSLPKVSSAALINANKR